MPSLGAAGAGFEPTSKNRAAAIADTLRMDFALVTCSALQERQRRLVNAPVAGDGDPAVGGEIQWRSAPVGGDAARSFDDRDDRAKIVGLQACFKDEIDKTGSEQAVGVAIGAE